MATITECMPLQNCNQNPLVDQHKSDDNSNSRKRKNCEKLSPTSGQEQKRFKEESTDMTDSPKKANFSALSPPNNGYNRSQGANCKSGAAKKLKIKNFIRKSNMPAVRDALVTL